MSSRHSRSCELGIIRRSSCAAQTLLRPCAAKVLKLDGIHLTLWVVGLLLYLGMKP